ncbi:hypothetical protein [Peribacillus acanthi]|uniref:hypothetical protein n=1 Tax=Peribacillus acanthi TaxID=2171554 RepID=UPI000D3E121E|nr:hypothetical protein [Peribacillus acanthi]
MHKLLAVSLMSVVFLSACGVNNNAHENKFQDENGTRLITNKPNAYEDGGIRYSPERSYDPNLNPYAQNNPYPLSAGEYNAAQNSDVNTARLVVLEKTTFVPGPITLNGNDLWVTAYSKGIFESVEEKRNQEAWLHSTLAKALPEYNIEVKVEEQRNK